MSLHAGGGDKRRFSTTISRNERIGFGLASGIPLLAPYELLIRPGWTDFSSPAWMIAFLVSTGAIAVSLLLLLIAIFGVSRVVEFDVATRTVRVAESTLLRRRHSREYSFPDIAQIDVVAHDCSEGPPTYALRLIPAAGQPCEFGNFYGRTEVESVAAALRVDTGCKPC